MGFTVFCCLVFLCGTFWSAIVFVRSPIFSYGSSLVVYVVSRKPPFPAEVYAVIISALIFELAVFASEHIETCPSQSREVPHVICHVRWQGGHLVKVLIEVRVLVRLWGVFRTPGLGGGGGGGGLLSIFTSTRTGT